MYKNLHLFSLYAFCEDKSFMEKLKICLKYDYLKKAPIEAPCLNSVYHL